MAGYSFTNKSSSADLDALKEKIGTRANYRFITYLYHVTKAFAKPIIVLTEKLNGSLAVMTKSPSTQSPIHNRLKGVFFSSNLRRGSSNLPDISPFGSERVKIPITNFADSKLHLFYNSHHYTKNTICYAILVLVKESDPDYGFCRDHMIELDLKSNPFIRLDFDHNRFQYCDPSDFNLWVELFVVGDVQLTVFNHTWDTVAETGRNQSNDDEECVIQ